MPVKGPMSFSVSLSNGLRIKINLSPMHLLLRVFLNYNPKNRRSCQILLSVSTSAFMSLFGFCCFFFKYQS